MIKRILLSALTIGLLFGLGRDSASGQDPEFSQFYATPIYTNPAMAGTGQCNRGGGVVVR